MRAFRDLSIRSKLTLIVMLTSGAALLLASTGFIAYELVIFRSSTTEYLATMADIVGSNSTAALAFNDPSAARETLEGLRAEKHILAAAIFARDGKIFATYLRGDLREFPRFDPRLDGFRFERGSMIVGRPIMLATERIGTVSVRSDIEVIRSRLARYAWIVLVVLLASALLAFLIAARLQGVISRPIYHLAETAHRVSIEKDYSVRARKHGQDELGVLIDGFNEMLDRIAESNVALQRAHDELERRVLERTTELRQEIAARKSVEETIRRLAYHDALTGLPNRLLFGDRLSQALARAERSRTIAAVLFLDLDRFKAVNDTLGHAMGDKMLCEVARRLSDTLRSEDTVARLGGDEFLILLPSIGAVSDATTVADKIVEAFKAPLVIDGHQLFATMSVGVASYPMHGRDGETLIKNADYALYHAKERGRNNWQLFAVEREERALERAALANSLRRAIAGRELALLYQPQIDARTGAIASIEALLRWNHPEQGLLSPPEFMDMAEDIGVMPQIDEWVLRQVCSQGRAWAEAGLPPVRLAVDISTPRFRQPAFVATVARIASEEGCALERLELEVSESVFMDNISESIRTMKELRRLGVQIVIDGFGTGYSSLSHLRRLPVAALKIDRSFVGALPHEADDVAIVTLIIAMAHNLKLKVVADGVETEAQRDFLLSRQCDVMQGAFFKAPAPADETTRHLAEMTRRKD